MTTKADLIRRRGDNYELSPNPEGQNAPRDTGHGAGRDESSREGDHEGAADMAAPDTGAILIEENENPEAKQIHISPGRPKRWKVILRRLAGLFAKRKLTKEEQLDLEEANRRRALYAAMKADALAARDLIQSALADLGYCYRPPKTERSLFNGTQMVKFSDAFCTPDAIWLQVDMRRRVRNVFVTDLMDNPKLITDLSLSLGRRVYSRFKEDKGAFFIIERASGVYGIPAHVKYQEMIDRFPKSADKLTFPLGMGTNAKPRYTSFLDMPHLLVAGASGTGKSNMVNAIICTLVSFCSPADLRLVLVDLKGGLEMDFYEGIPHLLRIPGVTETGICTDREQVPEALEYVRQESENRIKIIGAAGHKKITQYNAHRAARNRMPFMLVVIDEYADIQQDKTIARIVQTLLSGIAAKSRAAGIHILVGTQHPLKSVIDTTITANFPARMAFGCSTNSASMLIIGTGDAHGLAPAGRFIWQNGATMEQVQAPYMPDEMIREIVGSIREGRAAKIQTSHDVTLEEILRFAHEELADSLKLYPLYEKFKTRGISRPEISSILANIEGKIVEVGEHTYFVTPTNGGSAPRKLVDPSKADEYRKP